MARASMSLLIARLRDLAGDPSGAGQAWTDDQLQSFLDPRRADASYLELEAHPHFEPGGAITWTEFTAPFGDWESGAELVDASYEALTPDASDPIVGLWTFTDGVDPPVRLVGRTYDVHAAAADLLEAWAARVKREVDFRTGDQQFGLSRQAESMQALAAGYRRRQRAVEV